MCKLRMSSTVTRCLTRCMIELTPSRLTRVVKKTIARAYYKEINLTRLIRSPICVIILRQMLQAKHEQNRTEQKFYFRLKHTTSSSLHHINIYIVTRAWP